MANEYLNIIIDTVYRGRTNAKRAEDDIKGVGNASKEAKEKSAQFKKELAQIGVVLGTVALAAKVTWDAFKEGAALGLARDQFDALAESIGTTADLLLTDMREATLGMVSDAELVASATELMSGKLAVSHDAIVRMSSVSGQLNWDMGVLAQTINNQSTMRLDNLGLAVSDVIPRFEELRGTMDDKEAFALAVIEAGEDKLLVMGGAADTAAQDVAQLQTSWTNLTDKMKTDLAEVLGPVVAHLADIATTDMIDDMFGEANELALRATSFEGYVESLREANIAFGGVGVARAWYDAQRPQLISDLGDLYRTRYTPAIKDHIGFLLDLETVTDDVTQGYDNQIYMTAGLTRAERLHNRQMAENASEREDWIIVETEYALAMERRAQVMADTFSKSVEFAAGADAEAVALYNAADAAGANAEDLALLGVALGLFSEAQAEAALKTAATQAKIEELGRRLAEGMNIDEAIQELADFRTALDNATTDKTVTITTNYESYGTPPGGYSGPGDPDRPNYATGTQSAPGGMANVGEYGPETVYLPPGSRVQSTNVTHNNTQNMTLSNSRTTARILNRYLRNKSRPATVIG